PPSGITSSEDAILTPARRKRISSGSRDLTRNLPSAAWALRTHLKYVTQFRFQSESGDAGFDDDLEAAVAEWSRPDRFDSAGRMGLDAFLAVLECCAVLDGDCGALRLKDGSLQGIEASQIVTPDKVNPRERWTNGVMIGRGGRHVAYGVGEYDEAGRSVEGVRRVNAGRFYLHGYFNRFAQVRGVSPLASAINSMQDSYEFIDHALARMKVEQLFALVLFRDAAEAAGTIDSTAAVDDDGEETNPGGYTVDFGKGPQVLDLDPGDDAKFLATNSPGASSQDMLSMVIALSLKALDSPYSFYDESHTNFFGSRAAWQHYERSCTDKRANVARFLNSWLAWRIQLAIQDREIKLPRSILDSRYSLRRPWWEFIAVGMPWWDPSKEIDGDIKAVGGGFSSPQKVCRSRGSDFYRNIDETARALEYARERPKTMSRAPQMRIEYNASEAELRVYDTIGEWESSAGFIAYQVDEMKLAGVEALTVRVNSLGGSLKDGVAIYNTLRESGARVRVVVDGIAGSAASVVAMAGDEVEMPASAMLMIHLPSYSGVSGDAAQLRKFAESLDKWAESAASIYAAKSGKSAEEIRELMLAETWFTAAEAVEAGFADRVTGGPVVRAHVDLTSFRNAPEAAAVLVAAPGAQMKGDAMPENGNKPAPSGSTGDAINKADLERFTKAFGAENGVRWLSEGKSYTESLEAHVEALGAQHAEALGAAEAARSEAVSRAEAAEAKLAEAEETLAKLDRGESDPATPPSPDAKAKAGLAGLVRIAGK
ncbi:ATP-dependent Clp protease proteolytic subunit 2 (Endopeptidase Clp 2), partial [Durusdinium trenchii]